MPLRAAGFPQSLRVTVTWGWPRLLWGLPSARRALSWGRRVALGGEEESGLLSGLEEQLLPGMAHSGGPPEVSLSQGWLNPALHHR